MRVAVVGGAGYIGSHVSLALSEAGHEVIVFDNLRTGRRSNLENVRCTIIEGDIRRRADLERLFAERIDAVVHLAALKSVGESMRDPRSYTETNIIGTARLLEAMLEAGVHRIVFSSSAAVYGTPESLPLSEDHPLKPESYYGHTKAAIEQMLAWYAQLEGLRAVSLRYFNAVGCDSEGRIVVREPQPENLFPIVLEAALGDRDGITIYGTDYDTPDGTCVRDYVHVTDLADAHVRAIDYLSEHDGHTAFNLGVGSGRSVRECVDAARALFGDFPVIEGERRAGDPAASYADPMRAQRELDWKARITSVKEMLASMGPAYGLEGR